MEVEVIDISSDNEAFAGPRRSTRRKAKLFRSSSPASSPQKYTQSDNNRETWRLAGTTSTSPGQMDVEKTTESSGNSAPSSQITQVKPSEPRLPPLVISLRRVRLGGSQASTSPEPDRVEQLKKGAETARKVSGKRKREDSQPAGRVQPRREVSLRLQAAAKPSAPNPTPGLTSNGEINYHYFVRKYFDRAPPGK
ncbi:hypothetical protein FRC12_010219 [Ceratobasidium sp. 428]|nr:hypothetical protein FRC12_010219 [Ceratobasidium sp. 428]